jgi:type I restriction enzyme M protein
VLASCSSGRVPANLFYSTGIQLSEEHIAKIIGTYQNRTEAPRYSRRVEMDEIEKNDFNLNTSRYISTTVGEAAISLEETHAELVEIEKAVQTATAKHNAFLKELGLALCPSEPIGFDRGRNRGDG